MTAGSSAPPPGDSSLDLSFPDDIWAVDAGEPSQGFATPASVDRPTASGGGGGGQGQRMEPSTLAVLASVGGLALLLLLAVVFHGPRPSLGSPGSPAAAITPTTMEASRLAVVAAPAVGPTTTTSTSTPPTTTVTTPPTATTTPTATSVPSTTGVLRAVAPVQGTTAPADPEVAARPLPTPSTFPPTVPTTRRLRDTDPVTVPPSPTTTAPTLPDNAPAGRPGP